MKVILTVDGREITGKIGIDADESIHGIPPADRRFRAGFPPLQAKSLSLRRKFML
jgi:hypothetical protein